MDQGIQEGSGQGDDSRLDARVREATQRPSQVRPRARTQDDRGNGSHPGDQGKEGGSLLQGEDAQGVGWKGCAEAEGQARRTQECSSQGSAGQGEGEGNGQGGSCAGEEGEDQGQGCSDQEVEPRSRRGHLNEHGHVKGAADAAGVELDPLFPRRGGAGRCCRFSSSLMSRLYTRARLDDAQSHTRRLYAQMYRLMLYTFYAPCFCSASAFIAATFSSISLALCFLFSPMSFKMEPCFFVGTRLLIVGVSLAADAVAFLAESSGSTATSSSPSCSRCCLSSRNLCVSSRSKAGATFFALHRLMPCALSSIVARCCSRKPSWKSSLRLAAGMSGQTKGSRRPTSIFLKVRPLPVASCWP